MADPDTVIPCDHITRIGLEWLGPIICQKALFILFKLLELDNTSPIIRHLEFVLKCKFVKQKIFHQNKAKEEEIMSNQMASSYKPCI